MSTKYEKSDDVPNSVLAKRLKRLSKCATLGAMQCVKEFDMRVPPEYDRDADLVLQEAAIRLERMGDQ